MSKTKLLGVILTFALVCVHGSPGTNANGAGADVLFQWNRGRYRGRSSALRRC